ncbi:hypothetical protein scyTo_0018071 [Scyliorhinus torazame]|uniref:Uncharacterized protein n=1 Tax=Scyliorhinus torazame TaxID=75743 RepID=A0A401Q4M4_SCYTO|nr:hypothetical protein [Scyliorhinus torazame]
MPLALDDLVTFQTFCSAVSWLSKANVETKLRGLYQTLTFTSPLNEGTFQLLLQDVYPSDTSQSISQLSQLLLREIDSKDQGKAISFSIRKQGLDLRHFTAGGKPARLVAMQCQ